MKGDFSRKTFDATRHYSGVLMQQGRVQLDADWNEQLGIQRHRDYTEAEDVIGECGAPKHDAGFLVQPTPDGTDLVLAPGRFYVHGRLCELDGTAVDAVFVSPTEATVGQWHVDGADFAPNQWVELSASNIASVVVRVQATTPASRQLTFASSIAAFQNATAFKIRRLTTYLTQPDLPNPPFSSQPNPALPPAPITRMSYVGVRLYTESFPNGTITMFMLNQLPGYGQWFQVKTVMPPGESKLIQFAVEGLFVNDVGVPVTMDWVGTVFIDDVMIQ